MKLVSAPGHLVVIKLDPDYFKIVLFSLNQTSLIWMQVSSLLSVTKSCNLLKNLS